MQYGLLMCSNHPDYYQTGSEQCSSQQSLSPLAPKPNKSETVVISGRMLLMNATEVQVVCTYLLVTKWPTSPTDIPRNNFLVNH
jgi:hypothetical protein